MLIGRIAWFGQHFNLFRPQPSRTNGLCGIIRSCSSMSAETVNMNAQDKGDNSGLNDEAENLSLKDKGDHPGLTEITEGRANILHPASVFYNPVQEFNRDLTIALISEHAEEHVRKVHEKRARRKAREEGKLAEGVVSEEADVNVITESSLVAGERCEDGLRILEALAASGLRSVRFGLEIPGVDKVIANDFDNQAVEIIKKNVERNNLDGLVEGNHGDAAMVMMQHKSYSDRFHVVDLDPYGSASPFLDTAVQAVADGGLLCVTCTDAAVLCGNTPEKCFTMYGSMSLRFPAMHEMGLRIILRAISLSANRYGRYIVPVLSLSIDFYFRLFVRIYTGQLQAKHSTVKSGMVYMCTGCGSHSIQPLGRSTPGRTEKSDPKFFPGRGPPVAESCEHCGFKHAIGGPIYTGPLHDREFLEKLVSRIETFPERFGTHKRLIGVLRMTMEELDVPLFYEADELFKTMRVTPTKLNTLRSAILNAGYKVSVSHACKNSIKTDAPNSVIWDMMRTYAATLPTKSKHLLEDTAGYAIQASPPATDISFEPHPDANPSSREKGLVRFPPNPAPNWGPKPRARQAGDGETLEDRRLKNQGKRKRKADTQQSDTDVPSKMADMEEPSSTTDQENGNDAK